MAETVVATSTKRHDPPQHGSTPSTTSTKQNEPNTPMPTPRRVQTTSSSSASKHPFEPAADRCQHACARLAVHAARPVARNGLGTPGAAGRPATSQSTALAVLPASGSHLDAAAEIRARFEAVLRASPAPKVLPCHCSKIHSRPCAAPRSWKPHRKREILWLQVLGDYLNTSDGVDRRAFSWLSPASRNTAASPAGMLPPPPRSLPAPIARRPSSAAPLPASAASAAAAAQPSADGPAAERALALLEPPAKTSAAQTRIKLGEHTVLWQRGAQTPVQTVTVADSGTPEPSATRPALVDYPDTTARGDSPANAPSFEHSVRTASEVPSAAHSADADRSRSGGAPAWMVQHGSAEKAGLPQHAAEDSRLSSDEYPITSDGGAGGASDVEVVEATPASPPDASPEPAPDLPDAAYSEASERSEPGTGAPQRAVSVEQDGDPEQAGAAERSSPAGLPADGSDDIERGEPRPPKIVLPQKRSAEVVVIKRGRGRTPKRYTIHGIYLCHT